MYLPPALDELGRRQWGLVNRTQALRFMTARQLDRHLAAGSLIRVHLGVYRLAGAPTSWRQQAMAACLAYGDPVAVSHRAAANLWGLEDIARADPEVTVPPERSGRRPGITTHHAALSPEDVTRRWGIPVTTVARTLADLAGVVTPPVLERALDQAQRQHLATPAEVAKLQVERAGHGRSGNAALREALDFRLEHGGIGDSAWADQVWRWIVDAGLEPPARQVAVAIGGRARVLDMAYLEELIAIEASGFDFHGRRHRFDADATRTSELALAGWLVITVTTKQTPKDVADRVCRALAQRRAGGPGLSAGTGAPR